MVEGWLEEWWSGGFKNGGEWLEEWRDGGLSFKMREKPSSPRAIGVGPQSVLLNF